MCFIQVIDLHSQQGFIMALVCGNNHLEFMLKYLNHVKTCRLIALLFLDYQFEHNMPTTSLLLEISTQCIHLVRYMNWFVQQIWIQSCLLKYLNTPCKLFQFV